MNECLLVIDKEPGPTSFDIVRRVRAMVGADKVGHAGSLDPFASGVLVLLLGRATKLSNALLTADKRYIATIQLGEAMDTMDRTGSVTETKPIPPLTEESIRTMLSSYVGEWMQTPPMYSAKKIRGVRLYELARNNISVRRQPIPVQLYSMSLVSWESPRIVFEVHCSKGTYVRSLADDISRRLGTVGHLAELRRTSCGEFTLADSVRVDALGVALPSRLAEGYQNYLRLLRSEGKVPVKRPQMPMERHLQMPIKSGNSFVN